jgi:hypothetical protein
MPAPPKRGTSSVARRVDEIVERDARARHRRQRRARRRVAVVREHAEAEPLCGTARSVSLTAHSVAHASASTGSVTG